MLPLNGLHVQVDGAGFGIAADGGIAGIGERAGLAVAEASDVVLIAAEVLLFRCSRGTVLAAGKGWGRDGGDGCDRQT